MRSFDKRCQVFMLCLYVSSCSGNDAGSSGGQVGKGGSFGAGASATGGTSGAQSAVIAAGKTQFSGGAVATSSSIKGGTESRGGTASGSGLVQGGNAGVPVAGMTAAGGGVVGGAGNSSRGGASVAGNTTRGGASAAGGSSKGGTSSAGGASAMGGTNASSGSAYLPAFIIGADISRVQEHEERGVKFKDVDGTTPAGTTATGGGLLTILKNHGFNYIRLRLFVNPAAAGGYSSAGYCDLTHTVKFATGVKLANMGLLVDFHYSDTWADPAHQAKPAAWANLSTAAIATEVYNHTKNALTQLKAANARPDIVQIGNEIPSGMLWEDGRASGSNFTNLGTFLKAGVSATKDVDSNIKIMMHLDRCHQLSTNTWWLEGVWGQGVQFDILGESCYDRTDYQQPASSWPATFSGLIQNGTGTNKYAANYAKLLFMAAEYSEAKKFVNDTIYNIPNKRGLGTFVWEPTNWGEQMFDGSGKALAQYTAIYDNLAATYGKR